jgi:5-methylcytosine-specific restriction endonuclease McrA
MNRFYQTMERTLLLNTTYEPLAIVSWKRAITLVFMGKVEVVAESEAQVRSVRQSWRLPAVIRLMRYVKQHFQPLKFTRGNIYLRDKCTCQYCGRMLPTRDLTWDHVLPRNQGGVTDWGNIVTACIVCNSRKGGRTPEQAGMKLVRKPFKPSTSHALRLTLGMSQTPDTWRQYLFYE